VRASNRAATGAIVWGRKVTSFVRPAGLADGLALKELALLETRLEISPNNLGPPFSGLPGDSAFSAAQ
jgi:hypothetical protein